MAAFIGVDVGTGSVRSALVNEQGQVLYTSVMSIKINNPKQDFYEQSSTDIWNAVCHTVKDVTKLDQVCQKNYYFDWIQNSSRNYKF